jgi:hypothetical protein
MSDQNEQKPEVTSYEEDMKKYTKIDNLDEDSVVESGKYFLVSFVSPEGVMNCKMRGLKIRTYKNKVTFATLEEAKVAADEINKRDKHFHVFVGETGKWMGWDPEPSDRNFVEEEKWADKDQDLLMQKMREREEKNLNELNALVGKKKAMQNKETKAHKKRVAQALKDNATGKVSENTESSEPPEFLNEEQVKEEIQEEIQEENTKHTKKNGHNSLFIKERLRKKLQEKNKKEEENKIQKSVNEILTDKSTEKSTTKLDENMQKLSELLEKSKQS